MSVGGALTGAGGSVETDSGGRDGEDCGTQAASRVDMIKNTAKLFLWTILASRFEMFSFDELHIENVPAGGMIPCPGMFFHHISNATMQMNIHCETGSGYV